MDKTVVLDMRIVTGDDGRNLYLELDTGNTSVSSSWTQGEQVQKP